jgi:hypothetical protein
VNTAGQPVVINTVISNTVFNALTADLATGLSTCITKDGQTALTANIPWGGYKITGLGAPTTSGDALSFGAVATISTLTLTNALTVANGGTGAATLTGVLKGNGTSAFTAATAGTDFVAPGTATTFTAKQTFSGGTGVFGVKLVSALEKITVSATAATGTINYDATTQNILYYTSSATANWTLNIRGDGSNSLDSLMASGESLTIAFRVTQGATPYYNSAVTIDGNAVTPKWLAGAPTSGTASGVDTYLYEVVKTGSATFTVFASKASFS